MPVAVPAIAAAAATYGATAALAGTAFATATGLTLGGTLLVTSVGLAASLAVGSIMKPSSNSGSSVNFDAGGGGRTFMIRQPTAPHAVVVGRVRKSGTAVFMHSMEDDEGREFGYFYLQLALAAHECELIGDVFIHDELSTAAKFSGFVRFGKNLGAEDQVEDADFLAELGEIFEGHRGRGITNIAARLKGNAAAFPNGLPNLSVIMWGANQVYDPRTGTTGWTNNPALIYAWWKTWSQGQKVDWEDIDEDTLIDSANVCDTRELTTGSTECTADAGTNALTLAAGARGLDVGDGVQISSTVSVPGGLAASTTYYVIPSDDGTVQLATTVANAFTRTAIDLSDAGSGTLTLHYYDRARWKCNGTFTLDQDKDTIRKQLLSAMMGFDIEVGGKWFIHAAAPTLPTVTLDEDDLAGTMVTKPMRSVRDKFNGVRARFVDPASNWQPTDAPPWANADYVAEDGGIVLWEDVELPFTTDPAQVQQSTKLHLERNRRQRVITFGGGFSCVPLRPMQGVYVNNERYRWEQKQHLITGWTLRIPEFTVELVLQEDGPEVHDWSVADEIAMSAPQGVVLPDPSSIPAPESITVLTPSTLTWTQIGIEWGASLSAMLLEYETEYRARGDSDWTSAGKTGKDAARTMLITIDGPADFRVRAISSTNVASDWTESHAPDDPTGALSGGAGELTWTNPDADFIEIWRDGVFHSQVAVSTAPGFDQTQTSLPGDPYQVRAENADGNVSNPTAPVVVS